jgi:hypothetical protein
LDEIESGELRWAAGLSAEKKGAEAQEIPRWLKDMYEVTGMHSEEDR